MHSAAKVKEREATARRWVVRVIGTLAAVAGVGLFAAGQGLAAGTITVASVFFDTTATDHAEGVTYGPQWGTTPGPLATFTDTDCTTTCQPATDYTAHILWGDGTPRTSCPATDCTITFVSMSGSTGTYSIAATHAFVDEKNCPTTACGFTVKVTVNDTIDATSGAGDNKANLGLSVKDQLSGPSATPFTFSASTGVPFSGQIGSFHDGNQLAVPVDGVGALPEYSLSINWGDGTALDTTGTFTIDTINCGTAPGLGTGQGCPVALNGTHTYATSGTKNVSIVVQDGLDKQHAGTFTSTATVGTASSCTTATTNLSPSNPSVTTGTQEVFTATSTACPNPKFQFWLQYPANTGSWAVVQPFSNGAATWTWNTTGKIPGAYRVVVWANQTGHPTSTFEGFGSTYPTLTGCGPVSLTWNPASPKPAGTVIMLSGTTSVCANAQFEFWMLAPGSSTWKLAQGYSASATLTWTTTTGTARGLYHFSVWVKDANSGGAAGNSLGRWDNYASSTYTLT